MLKNVVAFIRRFAAAKRNSPVLEPMAASPSVAATVYAANVYGNDIPWEIPVQLNLRDVLNRGDCALDVGANIGGVAIAMSRIVGFEGSVHAFEANPQTLPRLTADLAANRITNVTVVPKAAWSVSGDTIPFYCDNSFFAAASSVHRRDASWQEVRVPTITLDDYCRSNRLVPRAIKLDVEGAEFDVLQGSRWLLEHHPPSWVLEYYPATTADRDPLEFLRMRGYTVYDSNLYRTVDRDFYLTHFRKVPMANLLAIYPASPILARYREMTLLDVLRVDCHAGTTRTDALSLCQPGRYIVSADFDGPPQAIAGLRVVSSDGRSLAFFEARVEHLQEHSCSCMVIEIDRPIEVHCELSCRESPDARLRSVKVTRIHFGDGAKSVAA